MTRRVLPVGLVLAAALADVRDLHELAFYLLVAAVPAMAVSALSFFGDLVETPGGAAGETAARLQAFFAALALVLTVIAAAARGQSALQSGVPPLGISALVGCLGVFTFQGLVTLALAAGRSAPPEHERSERGPLPVMLDGSLQTDVRRRAHGQSRALEATAQAQPRRARPEAGVASGG
jgi:hypothetical protein